MKKILKHELNNYCIMSFSFTRTYYLSSESLENHHTWISYHFTFIEGNKLIYMQCSSESILIHLILI